MSCDFPIVMVVWMDSTSDDQWADLSEHRSYAPHEIHSVGYLIDDADDHITLAQNIDFESETGSMVMKIPSFVVLSMDYLYDPDDQSSRVGFRSHQ